MQLQRAQRSQDGKQAVAREMAARKRFFGFWCGHLRQALGLAKKMGTWSGRSAFGHSPVPASRFSSIGAEVRWTAHMWQTSAGSTSGHQWMTSCVRGSFVRLLVAVPAAAQQLVASCSMLFADDAFCTACAPCLQLLMFCSTDCRPSACGTSSTSSVCETHAGMLSVAMLLTLGVILRAVILHWMPGSLFCGVCVIPHTSLVEHLSTKEGREADVAVTTAAAAMAWAARAATSTATPRTPVQ